MTLCQKAGLSGLEFCAGVPATVGGMITMNFGCWGSSISDAVERVHILKEDGSDLWLSQEELDFGYRNSAIHDQQWIVLEAQFNCKQKTPEKVKETIQHNIQERLSKQPLREPTFGSIFKNFITGKCIHYFIS